MAEGAREKLTDTSPLGTDLQGLLHMCVGWYSVTPVTFWTQGAESTSGEKPHLSSLQLGLKEDGGSALQAASRHQVTAAEYRQ